jgi:hypothetical protein
MSSGAIGGCTRRAAAIAIASRRAGLARGLRMTASM